jgi:3-methyladenine DNA glycosylase AlkC
MAANLKDIYTLELITKIADDWKELLPELNSKDMVSAIMDETWESLELRERMKHIAGVCYRGMNMDYPAAVELMIEYAKNHKGFEYLFLPDMVEMYGQNDLKTSLYALKELTKSSTGEFAIRTFLDQDYETCIEYLYELSKSDDVGVRRFASEGSRMKLPWGKSVKRLIAQPHDILRILNQLKTDPHEYVKKSVANNINDMSKYYPDLVNDTIELWQKEHNPHTNWIIKRGARTLIKLGIVRTLELLGYTSDTLDCEVLDFSLSEDTVKMGGISNLSYCLKIQPKAETNIKVNLIMGFMKANGKLSEKTFHLMDKKIYGTDEINGTKKYEWKDLTTRKHYPGLHTFTLTLNGTRLAETSIMLLDNN